jgi:hypothetical protein
MILLLDYIYALRPSGGKAGVRDRELKDGTNDIFNKLFLVPSPVRLSRNMDAWRMGKGSDGGRCCLCHDGNSYRVKGLPEGKIGRLRFHVN